MNVVIISGNAYGEDYGGVAEHVKYLLSHLSEFDDIRVNLITFGNENISYEKDRIKYVVLKRMKFGKIFFPLELIFDIFRLRKVVQKIGPDMIHLQSTIPLFSLFGIFMIKKYPIVITLHGYFNQEYKFHTGIKKIFYGIFCAPIERFALSKIPHVIVLCPQIENIIQKSTRSKIFIIPNGINLEDIQKINSYEKKDHPAIFFLGYLTKGKGVEDLIKAIQLVKIKFDNVKLYIGGIGPYMTKLQKLVQDLNLKENVTFLGLLDGKEKFAYMKSMDIFVLPSYWESFPIVLLEAMACGKSIITTNVGGNPHAVINDANGFLVKPGDCYELSEKIIKLLNDKDLIKKMGEESLKRATDFEWSIIAKQTREVYGKIASCYSKKG